MPDQNLFALLQYKKITKTDAHKNIKTYIDKLIFYEVHNRVDDFRSIQSCFKYIIWFLN
jgi:hypothetical protein